MQFMAANNSLLSVNGFIWFHIMLLAVIVMFGRQFYNFFICRRHMVHIVVMVAIMQLHKYPHQFHKVPVMVLIRLHILFRYEVFYVMASDLFHSYLANYNLKD